MRSSIIFKNLLFAVAAIVIFGGSNLSTLDGQTLAAKSSTCANEDSGLKLPPGFCATVFADQIGHARHMAVSPNGVVYVNTWSGRYYGNKPLHDGGFLVALQDKTGTGKADVIERFGETVQSGGAGGTGIGLYNGSLYAEINDRIVRYSLPSGSILPSTAPETIISKLPLTGDHPMHPFAINAEGSMFVDVATATNSCQGKNRTLKSPGANPCTELETRGGVWRYDANKTNQLFSPAERFSTGIRNAEGFAIDSAGRVFVTQHGRDQLYTNWPDLYTPTQEATIPAEELMLLKSGGDFGWPECYYDGTLQKLVLAPEYGGDGGKAVGPCANKTAPVAAFPAHWAPNAMVYYDKKQFPSHYQNGVFIAFHGSWNRAPFPQGGYNVVFQALSGDHASGKCEVFADGFAGAIKTPDKADHRPSGLAVGPDGALYVSDDVGGRIYRIVYRGGASQSSGGNYTPCPSASAPAGKVVEVSANPPEGTNPDAGVAAASAVPQGATRAMVALGNRIYHGQVGGAACTGCHGATGAGTPLGPDLTGKKWLWSDGSYAGIAKTITDGVAQPKEYRSPMPPLGGTRLTPDQVSAVAAYVWSLGHQQTRSSANPQALPNQLTIPGEKVFPESITSTTDGRVIVGSITKRTIFIAKPGSASVEPWIMPDKESSLGVFGLFADNKSRTLWACFSPIPTQQQSSKAPAALASFDLQTGKLKARYVLPTSDAFCNDMAVGGDGTVYVSDTNNMEIDRLKPGAQKLEVWAGNGSFGPKGGILDGISVLSNRVLVNALNTNKLFAVPVEAGGKAGAVTEIKLSREIDHPDGMRSFGKDSLLVVEGGGPGRLSRIKIDGNSGELTTLKEGFPEGAVAVTVVGTTGYVLEGQLAALFGPPDPKLVLKPFRATSVEVGKP